MKEKGQNGIQYMMNNEREGAKWFENAVHI